MFLWRISNHAGLTGLGGELLPGRVLELSAQPTASDAGAIKVEWARHIAYDKRRFLLEKD